MASEATVAARCTAEFVGTFLLLFTIGCNVLGGSAASAGLSAGGTLMAATYALDGVSGANFNPAVSLALALSKYMGGPGLDLRTAGLYVGVQLAAGVAAGACYSALFWNTLSLAPARGFGWFQAGLCEMLYSCMLCLVFLSVSAARSSSPNQFHGLAIGLVLVAGQHGAAVVSGGCFNPAVTVGIDAWSAGKGFGWCAVYALFELAGAALAAALFRAVRPEEFGAQKCPAAELVSEFLGAFFLVLTVGLNVLGASAGCALSIGASLTCMTYALGDVSGAHFNPAVTTAIAASGRCPELTPRKAGRFVAAQLAGGISAAFAYSAIHRGASFRLGPGARHSWREVGAAEAACSCLLCYAVLCVAVSPRTKSRTMSGLAIGASMAAGCLAIGAISGGSLNPAISFGIASAHLGGGGGEFLGALAYSVFELAGAAVAAGLFRATHAVDLSNVVPKSEV